MKGIFVTLSEPEIRWARLVAQSRDSEARRYGASERLGHHGPDTEEAHALALMGQMAVAKYLDLKDWEPTVHRIRQGRGANVGGWNVVTRSRPEHDLYVREDNPEDLPVVLVTGPPPTFRVVGWTTLADAHRDGVREDKGGYGVPAYWVQKGRLKPIEDLSQPDLFEADALHTLTTRRRVRHAVKGRPNRAVSRAEALCGAKVAPAELTLGWNPGHQRTCPKCRRATREESAA